MVYDYGKDNKYPELYVEHSSYLTGKPSMKTEHYHDSFELYYYMGTHMKYAIEGKTTIVNSSDIVIIGENVAHRTIYLGGKSEERMVVLFKSDVLKLVHDSKVKDLEKWLCKKIKISIDETKHSKIVKNLFRILRYYKSHTELGILKAKLALLELLLNLREISTDRKNSEIEEDTGLVEEKIPEVITYIEQNYNTNISLDMLAERFSVNKYYLCDLFKKTTGISIIRYVNEKRLNVAKELLLYSSCNITDISSKVGFNNINHFINIFKRKFTYTPKIYRELLRNSVCCDNEKVEYIG